MLYCKTLIELAGPKTVKKLDFFSLGEVFIGIGMGLGMGEISSNTFGNTAHPRLYSHSKIRYKMLKMIFLNNFHKNVAMKFRENKYCFSH